MARKSDRIPFGISEYVNAHFREDFLLSCRKITTLQGTTLYDVEISKDNITHQFMFDENGKLLKEGFNPDFPADPHEESLLEETPPDEQ